MLVLLLIKSYEEEKIMKIAENVHLIRKEFYVTPEVKRYINIYLITGENCYLIDSGVSGSEKITMIFKQADILQYAGNPLVVKSIDACRKYLLQMKFLIE